MKKLVLLAAIAGLTFLQFTHDTLADVSQDDKFAHPTCWTLYTDIMSIYAEVEILRQLIVLNRHLPDEYARLLAQLDNLRNSLDVMMEHWAALGCNGKPMRDPKNPDSPVTVTFFGKLTFPVF